MICDLLPDGRRRTYNKPATGRLQGVDVGTPDSRRMPLSVLPYFGPAWYGRGTVAFLLDAGICRWRDLMLTFMHRPDCLPANCVGDGLKALEALWLEVGATFQGWHFLEQRSNRDTNQPFWQSASPWLFSVSGVGENTLGTIWRRRAATRTLRRRGPPSARRQAARRKSMV